MKRLSRRTVLRGLGGVAVALPLLEAMEAHAQEAPPKRLVTMFTPNGTLRSKWLPTGGETNFTLGPILSPLEPLRSKLLILGDVDLAVAEQSPGSGHLRGIGSLFTGHKLDTTRLFGSAGWAMGPSIDQVVAARIGTTTKLGSLELGVQVAGNTVADRISYRAATQPLPPRVDPLAVFEALFSQFDTDPVVLEQRRAHRRSVLDFVRGELATVAKRVSVEDRRRLDGHATSIRELEQRLDATFMPSATCAKPEPPLVVINDPAKFPEIGRLQMDLLVMALTCDLTRVASLQWSSGASPVVFTWLGQSTDHHEISHRSDSDLPAQAAVEAIDRWYAEQFAYLLSRLEAIEEQGSPLLDRCVLLWGNEMGKGNDHSHTSTPFVLAGSAGGYFRTGRFLDRKHQSHNDLLTSVVQAFGVPVTTFGDPDFCTGPMSDLT